MRRTFPSVAKAQVVTGAVTLLLGCEVDVHTDPEVAAAMGTYWSEGTGTVYKAGVVGPLPSLVGTAVYATQVSIGERADGLVLTMPACPSGIPLVEVTGARGRKFTADGVSCSISDTAAALGVKTHFITALSLDLDERRLHLRVCEDKADGSRGCGQDDGTFFPGPGGGGAGGSDGTQESVQFRDSVKAYRLNDDKAITLQCSLLDETRTTCADTSDMKFRTKGHMGTVYQMKDGSYYIAGWDCLVPNGYSGAPIRCGTHYDGREEVGTPTAWATALTIENDTIHFEAEMRGADYKYYLLIDAPLLPL